MDTGKLIKWGAILLVGFFALRWLSNMFSSGFDGQAGYPLTGGSYMAPLQPFGPVVYPWQPYHTRVRGRGGRGYGRGRR